MLSKELKNCQCESCLQRLSKRKAANRFDWFDGWFVGKLALVLILWAIWLTALWAIWLHCVNVVNDIEPIKTYNPYEILGVADDAPASIVKKAYRKL